MKKNYQMGIKTRHFTCLFTCLLSLSQFFSCSQKNVSESVYIDDNIFTTVSLEEFATEVKVSQIKTDILLDDVSEVICFGEDAFLLSKNEKVYYMKDDSIVSVRNSFGRGPGEYSSIDILAYSPKDSILYAYDMIMNVIHSYKIPSFSFERNFKTDYPYNDLHCMMNNDEDLVYVSGEYVLSRSLSNDSITELLRINPINYIMTGSSSFYLSSNNELYLAIQDRNTIVYRYDDRKLNKTYSFNYGENGIPEEICESSDVVGNFYSYISKEDYSIGCFYPIINESGIKFWHFKKKDGDRCQMFTIYDGLNYENYRFNIPGINIKISPDYYCDDWYVMLIKETKETLLNADEPLSPLGQQIIDAIDAQENGNPILLYFKLPTTINK